MKKVFSLLIFSISVLACSIENGDPEYTGNSMFYNLIPGSANGLETNGTLIIRERADGTAQFEILMTGVLNNANHPVHLHYGSLEDNGNIAAMLNPVLAIDGIGKSLSFVVELENGEEVDYNDMVTFDGSLKVHFEASGPLKDQLLGSINIGSNSSENQAYLDGDKSITICNSEY